MAGNGGIIGPTNTIVPTSCTVAEKITTFNSSGTLTTQSHTTKIRTLVVAGGGGGGDDGGGGGGAGGFRDVSCISVSASSPYPITVGGGGAGATGTARGTSGVNSIAGFPSSTITSTGGGGAGSGGGA